MAMTRKHYRELADLAYSARTCDIPTDVIGTESEMVRHYILGWFIGGLSDILANDNPNFDEYKFADWCANGPPMKN